MKKKKSIIIIIISILVVIGIAIGLYFILNDKDKLTVSERNWVNQNIGTIQNINVIMKCKNKMTRGEEKWQN